MAKLPRLMGNTELMQEIRETSFTEANRLGFPINPSLPLLHAQLTRTTREVADRSLAIYILVSIAHGAPPEIGIRWLEQESLTYALTKEEASWLEARDDQLRPKFAILEEALMALMWALNLVEDLDFAKYADDSLPGKVPKIRSGEGADDFRELARLRPDKEIFSKTDLAYCLHWAVVDAYLHHRAIPGQVRPYVIVERRRALEWLTSGFHWDEISLDT